MNSKILRKNEVFENQAAFAGEINQNVILRNYTTMKIGGQVKNFAIASSEKEVEKYYEMATDNGWKIFPLGEGSNTIFSDKDHDLFVIKMENKGIIKTYDGPEFSNIEVQAGEGWDDLVKWSVEHDLSGLECLSGIPGTVGAGPIQNIGAYGSEIKDTLSKVRVLDLESGDIVEVANPDCQFEYRDSIFKKNLGKFIILSVSFSLSKRSENLEVPTYKDVQLYFLEQKKKKVNAAEIRGAILEIRGKKIPWPSEIPNTGSFFKNPIVSTEFAGKIVRENPEMPYFKVDDEEVKLYAGWLIEKGGLKGFNFGRIKIDENNSLVLTNPKGGGNFADLEKAVKQIQAQVFQNFEIELEVEPNIIE